MLPRGPSMRLMHILVTGGSGFIGSNFIRYWRRTHPHDFITNLDALTYAGNPANLVDIAQDSAHYRFIQGSITDPAVVHDAFEGVDVVVHFAAESHVDRSILGSKAFFETNVEGTRVLLEEVKARGTQILRFHHVSTDEVFGSLPLEGQERFTETTPYKPRSPYSASKAASDHLCDAYAETHHLPITRSNCSNNYGPYHFPEKFIPLAITNLIRGKKIPVYGEGINIRDWLHVDDHCRAIETILLQGVPGQVYCVGGDAEYRNIDVARLIAQAFGRGDEALEFVTDRKGHDLRYAIDHAKITHDLGWTPSITFAEGLRTTIEWFKANESWWRPLLPKQLDEPAALAAPAIVAVAPSSSPSPTPHLSPSPSRMKILIFGKGWIGTRMSEAWHHEAVLSSVRIDDRAAVLAEIEAHQPDVIVNAAGKAGIPNVDWCETHQLETMRSNTIGALVLAEVCQEKQIYLLHLGTGCIFYGQHSPTSNEPWGEDDFGNPEAFYTRSKYATDLLLSRLPKVGIARFRMPIDHIPSPKNLIDKLVRYTKVIDVENSVTILDDLIRVCYQLLEKRGEGVFHVVNPGTMRHRDLLDLYKKHVDPSYTTEWITAEDLLTQGLAARKRSNNFMKSTRLEALGITMRPIQEALEDTMQKYAVLKRVQSLEGTWNFHLSPTRPRETRGVITAGGNGTRLMPLTKITNKHLLPIYNQPMVLYPLQTLLKSGVRDILLVTGPEYAHQFMKLLGSGAQWNCRLSYRIQDQAGGIAQALALAEEFVGAHNSLVVLGDNIFTEDFSRDIREFTHGAKIFHKLVDTPQQYGVVEIGPNNQVLSIEEKPKQPKSSYAQLGAYLYDPSVFDVIRSLKPSARGELEISEVNSTYLTRGHLTSREVTSEWFDAGTFRDLHRAGEYFQQRDTPSQNV